MTAVFFYAIILTAGAVFLITAAHDEVTAIAHAVVDLFTKLIHGFWLKPD